MMSRVSAVLALVLVVSAPHVLARGSGHGGGGGGGHSSSGSHSSSAAAGGSHAIRAHTTKSGTQVAASRATNPNSTKRDNYSSKGNVNPANGRVGTKNPDK
jgi:hypothetical protein